MRAFSVILLGHGYFAPVVLMVVLDVVHPPAVVTSLIFALRTGAESTTILFLFGLGMTVGLVVLQRIAAWLLSRAVGSGKGRDPDAS